MGRPATLCILVRLMHKDGPGQSFCTAAEKVGYLSRSVRDISILRCLLMIVQGQMQGMQLLVLGIWCWYVIEKIRFGHMAMLLGMEQNAMLVGFQLPSSKRTLGCL